MKCNSKLFKGLLVYFTDEILKTEFLNNNKTIVIILHPFNFHKRVYWFLLRQGHIQLKFAEGYFCRISKASQRQFPPKRPATLGNTGSFGHVSRLFRLSEIKLIRVYLAYHCIGHVMKSPTTIHCVLAVGFFNSRPSLVFMHVLLSP